MVIIKKIHARQVLDSRGNPTIEVEVRTNKGFGKAIVPSGASTGIHEALELRDGKKAYGGKGVEKAIDHVHYNIARSITNKSFSTIKELDEKLIALDGTPNKTRLGANAILGVSMAFARALAIQNREPLFKTINEEANFFKKKKDFEMQLPVPFANVINGGVHAGNELEMQEFMIAPTRAKNFSEATRIVAETYHELKKTIGKKYGKNSTNLGDEGGFAPPIQQAEQALDLIMKTIDKVGYNKELRVAMDAAASEFYNKKDHSYLQKRLLPEQLGRYYERLTENYPFAFLEDPFDQDDFQSWKAFMSRKGNALQVVADDLTVSNPARVQLATSEGLANSLLLKVNQIGTITESLTSARIAKNNKWRTVVSHRSGETEDPFIADFVTGLGVGQIKIGAPARGERVAKYNQLLRIEESLGRKAKYARWKK